MPADPAHLAAALPAKLRPAGAAYFPVRHHSPACADHLRRWIAIHRPASVLVEGPASLTGKIPLLLDAETACPVAFFTTFVDRKGRLGEPGPGGPARFAAFYPFCDYSPELAALRAGRDVGARLRFIDLEYPEMVLSRHATPGDEAGPVRADSLAADRHLSHSDYVRELARRLGCRDGNEAWDHLFETRWDDADTDAFLDAVAVYCLMARLSYEPGELAADGTDAREKCMAAHIIDELRRVEAEGSGRPVLVVTGGFHTVVLPDLITAGAARPKPPELGDDEAGAWLMRYSFDQLDALAGYSAGMPQPAFYDRLWHAGAGPAARARAAVEIAVEVGRLTRSRGFHPAATTPDAAAAVHMSLELARMRGHPWPGRDDVLDGMRGCYVKGDAGTDGAPLLRLVNEVLAGNRVGRVPAAAGVPPIVDDFLREARRLKLPVDAVERKELALDLYRDARHRAISRLLHRLALLGSPFGAYVGGPDFAQGIGLDRVQEQWRVAWSPAAESALLEAALYGATVEEAAGAKLRLEVAALEADGSGHDTAAAVGVLVRACRLGLHRQAAELTALVGRFADADPLFPSVVAGLTQLELLARSREPLEAGHLDGLPRLADAAYRRACFLAGDLADVPDELVDPCVRALQSLRELLAAEERFDPELLALPLAAVAATPGDRGQPAIVGAAAGVRYGQGAMSEAELVALTAGVLGGTSPDPRRAAGFVRGLLATAREAAWQVGGVVRALDARFGGWDDGAFLGALPELRLAFSDLTPREVARVADAVAALHGGASLGPLVETELSEADALLAAAVARRVRESLAADGLC